METTRTSHSPLRRRSQRIPLAVPLLVTSLDPSVKFAERCETVSVSSHGCRLRAPRPLEPGVKLRLDILHTDRTTAASVVHCEPMGPMAKLWEISLELEEAENFWGIQFPPEDWAASALTKERPSPEARAPSAAATAVPPRQPAPRPPPAPAAPPTATAPPRKEEPAPAPTVRTPAAAAAPPRPATPTQPYPAAPTSVDQTTQDLERLWREKAKAIAAEFEDSYRQSLGDLLVRLRADLEERAAADWERLRQQTLQEIEPRAQQVLEQIEQESEQRRQHATEAETKLQAFRELQEKVEEQLRTVGDTVQEQVAQEREQLLARTREELEKLEAGVRQQVDREREQRTQDAAALRGQLEEIHQVRDYVESLIRLLPQTVDQRVQDGIATTLDHIRARMEEEFTTQREAQGEQLERHLFRLADQTGADLRQKLLEDLDRQQRELLDRVEVRLEEVRALETNPRQYAGQMGSELAGKSEQLRSELGGRLDQQAARHQQAFTARVEEYTGQLNQRAENTLRNLGGQVWTSLKQQLEEEFGRRQQELRQNLETAQTETARLEARAEK
ncbi:MAG: PilZ domain-containing protein, partial [Terriglobia bacterium]